MHSNKKTIIVFLLSLIFLFSGIKFASAATVYPSLSIDTPTNNMVVVNNTVSVRGKVQNADKLIVNGVERHFSSTGVFSFNLTLKNIVNTIDFTVFNGVYSTSYSRAVYYSFPPTIDITSHESGDEVHSSDVIIQGNVTPKNQDDIQSFTVNGVETPVDNGTFRSYPIILKSGTNEIKLVLKTKAINISGTVNIPSREFTKTIKLDYIDGPEINITNPDLNDNDETETLFTNQVTIEGKIENNDGIEKIKVGSEETDVDDNGYFEQDVTLVNGKNEIKITATDGSTSITKTIIINASLIPKDGAKLKFDATDGQEIKAFTDAFKVKLAKDSVDNNTTAEISIDNDFLAATPKQTAFVSPVYRLKWDGDEPIKPYKVTIKYDNVVSENQSHKVTILLYDEKTAGWTNIGGIVDAKSRTISVQTIKSGYFAAATCYLTFNDVNHHWAKRDIEFLVARGAISGRQGGEFFQPEASITRAEFVTCLVKALGISPYKPIETSYYDVQPSHWAFQYIEAASRAGLISGTSYRAFAPNKTITREEAAAILARAGSLKQTTDQEAAKLLSEFTDESKISPWARKDVATAIKGKIMSGTDHKQFLPRKTTTRAQAVSMIARLVEIVNKNSTK